MAARGFSRSSDMGRGSSSGDFCSGGEDGLVDLGLSSRIGNGPCPVRGEKCLDWGKETSRKYE